MNWVQSALDGRVPIQRVLCFPDMCLDDTRHTHAHRRFALSTWQHQGTCLVLSMSKYRLLPASCSQGTCMSNEAPAERSSTCTFLLRLGTSGSLAPNSFVTQYGVNMKWPHRFMS